MLKYEFTNGRCVEKNIEQTKKDWVKLDTLIYVGTYTNWNENEMKEELLQMGKGIHILRIDRDQKRLVYENVVTGIENPSFLTVDNKNNKLYAVNELQEYKGEPAGSIGAYFIDSVTGNLTTLNKKSTGGKDPCHVVLSDDERFMIVTNYSSGSVCVYEIREDRIGERTALVLHQGSSINKVRQSEAHAHSSISIKGKPYIIVMDLGMDQLLVYEIKEDGSLSLFQASTYYCDKGSGPRHAVFHPSMKYLYVINELSSSISVLKVNQEKLNFDCIQTISTLPKECECSNTAADIHVSRDGRFLYASNRGHDSIAVYEIDKKDGTLQILQYVPCGGKTPRNFMIDSENEYLIVANQDSNDIVMFEIQKESGLLIEVDKIEVPKPVCLCQVKLNNTHGKQW